MKQPRSNSNTSTRLNKKPLLPSFKQSKASSKVQQLISNNKNQIYFNTKIIPIEVIAQKKNGEVIKTVVNTGDVVVHDGGKVYKAVINLSSAESNQKKVWAQLNFGEVCNNVKIKKVGDENIFGANSTGMVSWDNIQSSQRKLITVINIKDIIKTNQKPPQLQTTLSLQVKQDKSKQMKAFVANLMSKKLNRRTSQTSQVEPRNSLRKRTQMLKSKLTSQQIINHKKFPPSTATSILSGISGVKSFRKQIINKNLLKQSKFTEKETSIGDQSTFLNHKANVNLTQLSSLQCDNIEKQKNKFDSQPYFYQKSTLTSHFLKQNQSSNKIQYSRQQKLNTTLINRTVKVEHKPSINNEQNLKSFLNKSQHQSQNQVQQDIKRSQMINSSLKNSQQQFQSKRNKKNQKDQQSSQCVQSKQYQSSGTIYQSRYQ